MATATTADRAVSNLAPPPGSSEPPSQPARDGYATGELHVIRRNGKVTAFNASKIAVAITKAFLAVEGGNAAASPRIHNTVKELTGQIIDALTRRNPEGGTVHIEDIQDQVELALMRAGEHKVARAYVIYREERKRERDEKAARETPVEKHPIQVALEDGSSRPLDIARLRALVEEACAGLEDVDADTILNDACRTLYDGIKERDVSQALVMSARSLIDKEPNHSRAAARLLLDILRREALDFLGLEGGVDTQANMGQRYGDYFRAYIDRQAEAIRKKTGCAEIQFRIAVEEGKMKLKARPLRRPA